MTNPQNTDAQSNNSDLQKMYDDLANYTNLMREGRADYRPSSYLQKVLNLWSAIYQEYRAAVDALPTEQQPTWKSKGRCLKVQMALTSSPTNTNGGAS